jgi:hypothetical protein
MFTTKRAICEPRIGERKPKGASAKLLAPLLMLRPQVCSTQWRTSFATPARA